MNARSRHLLDQLMAYHLEVQGKLLQFQNDLEEIGYSEEEAWAIARRLEERILGPIIEYVSRSISE